MKLRNLLVLGVPAAAACIHSSGISTKENFPILNVHAKEKQRQLQLQQVQVLFRHGARTPINYRPGSKDALKADEVVWDVEKFGRTIPCVDIPYKVVNHRNENQCLDLEESYMVLPGGCKCGNLTSVGQQEAYNFGTWLNEEYIGKHDFLSPANIHRDVYVRSTLKSRAVFTAVGVMAGLFSSTNTAVEPITIHSAPLSDDPMFPNFLHCHKLHQRFMHKWNAIQPKQEEMNRNLEVEEGNQLYNFIQLEDVANQRLHHGLFVPPYLLERREELTELALDMLVDILGGDRFDELKPSIGGFVDMICCSIDDCMDGTNRKKMVLYSSHDTAVMSLLLVLGVFDGKWPPFVSNVILELYRDIEEVGGWGEGPGHHWYVRVLHNGEAVVVDKETGEEHMPVHKFTELVEKFRVADWNACCGNVKDDVNGK